MAEEVTTNDVMDFLREHMVTRQEMREFMTGFVARKIQESENRLLIAMDSIRVKVTRLDHEYVALKSKVNRIEEKAQ